MTIMVDVVKYGIAYVFTLQEGNNDSNTSKSSSVQRDQKCVKPFNVTFASSLHHAQCTLHHSQLD